MKILFVTVHSSTFNRVDYEILKSRHLVTYYDCSSNRHKGPGLIKLIKENDLIFFWFISLRFISPLIWSKLLHRKVVFVAGGYDVASLKELSYGSMYSAWKSILIRNMIRMSDKVISVSYSNHKEIINNCGTSLGKIEMIYHGLKPPKPINYDNKEDKLVTIGFIDQSSYYRKGIDRFLELANHMSETEFHIIGRIDVKLEREQLPKNVITHGYLDQKEFVDLLESAKIYIQFSRHEAFGYSLAEAMQYGCIPVVSNSYSLPEVVGKTGLIINSFDNYEEIAQEVKKILKNYSKEMANECFVRVRNTFSFKERSDKLLTVINNVL